jgi:hypothetical protein
MNHARDANYAQLVVGAETDQTWYGDAASEALRQYWERTGRVFDVAIGYPEAGLTIIEETPERLERASDRVLGMTGDIATVAVALTVGIVVLAGIAGLAWYATR